ncbi:MAG: benzoate-CoA ligase family protein [Acidobacteria bacterium]|nr:benzoate-CoA ligase family protein [Acidobacteriota bacterium]
MGDKAAENPGPQIEVPEQYNLAAHFVDRHVAEGRGGKIALRCEGQTLTYSQVLDQVNRVGNGLRRLDVREEQRVLLLLPDCPEFVAAYFGAIKMGAVAVPTNTALRAPDYAYFLDESRARALVVHASLWPQIEPILGARRYLRHVIVSGEPKAGCLFWDDWLGEQSAALEAAPTSRDDIAFWLWTSGSTGFPKAAVHLHHDWVYCCENYARGVLGIGPEDRVFSASKLFHAYGLGNALAFPFHVGATATLYPGKPQAKVILQKAHEARPTLFFSVPTLYAAMLQETDAENPYDLSSVRLGISAAEPLAAEIYRRWKERFGFELLDGIGSTEVLHIYASPRAGRVRPGSTGQPAPGYQVRITNEAGQDLPRNQVGDLWVRGESTAPYYWNRHQLSKERMQGEWFLTGDKYYQDEDDYLWYAGRSDDMFRVSGQWVSPIEIENALIEHPAVLESAVVAHEEENRLLKPKAYVVLKQGWTGDDALVQALQDFLKQRVTPYKYPRRIEFVKELPKTAAGKIQRFKLRGDVSKTNTDAA